MFKKITFIFIFIFSFFIWQNAFAFTAGPSIKNSDVSYYVSNNVVSGKIRKPPKKPSIQKKVYIYLLKDAQNYAGIEPEIVGEVDWRVGDFSIQVNPSHDIGYYSNIVFGWKKENGQKTAKMMSLSGLKVNGFGTVTSQNNNNNSNSQNSPGSNLLFNIEKHVDNQTSFIDGYINYEIFLSTTSRYEEGESELSIDLVSHDGNEFSELVTLNPNSSLNPSSNLYFQFNVNFLRNKPDKFSTNPVRIIIAYTDKDTDEKIYYRGSITDITSILNNNNNNNQNNNNIVITLSSYEFKNTKPDKTGDWALRMQGTWTRSIDEDIYLILEDIQNGHKTSLCHYQSGGGNSFNLNFPLCAGTPNPNIVSLDGNDYGKISSLISGHAYKVYFSSSAGGISHSQEINIGSVPQPPANVNGIVTDLVVIPKEQSGKRYYEISGKVTETKAGKILNFVVIKDGETTGEIIGETEYTKNNVFIIPTAGELQNIGSLAPGHYRLEIKEIGGGVVQTYQIPTEISAVNQQGGADPLVSNQTVQDIRAGKGLVKGDCGYKLGDGGRMCGLGDFIELIQRIIEYIFVLILPIAAIVFAYAGYLFMTSGGDPNKRNAAKNAMTKLVLGIVVIMMAWLMVKTILVSLGVSAGFRTFLKF